MHTYMYVHVCMIVFILFLLTFLIENMRGSCQVRYVMKLLKNMHVCKYNSRGICIKLKYTSLVMTLIHGPGSTLKFLGDMVTVKM